MLSLSTENLTQLENKIHGILSEEITNNSDLKILEAATLCQVSSSKISKLVRKLGFENFKQYKLYFSGQATDLEVKKRSSEIERLMQFLEDFDPKMVDDFISVFNKYNKVILFGLGPSHISMEYFAYKLGAVTDKNIFSSHDENYVKRLADEDTLLIVFSVTGRFSSFENLFTSAKMKGSGIMLVLEEHINTRDSKADYVFHLSKYNQSDSLQAFEKTRTVFFIFMEEIVAKLEQRI
ncbi:MurR/RpiR family transcriptional regulator [Pontibacillus yanchengensis]|uniref:RpiR family transcriptional regulator n=1 Tax=Pontibacillus yanchengensis Y32 TaxID=1385514 RepID=A0A0A2TFZ5_9BACI|nr:SIS domain-containing protein [Pontibacillus yanchengensis]KGP74469.1 RpiR family transcriptional regulator [Pontibacillus yanchengensis Y32]